MSDKQHDLVAVSISSAYGYDDEKVVRWCRQCGAVVVDLDHDNRTVPGYYLKMKIPVQTEDSHCRAK